MKKILLISDHYGCGGVSTVHCNLAKGFKALGFEPVLVSAFIDKVDVEIPEGVSYEAIETSSLERKLLFPLIVKLALHLRKHKDAYLIISGKEQANFFTVCARLLSGIKVPLVCNSHNTVSEQIKNLDWKLFRQIANLCKIVYPLSDYVANVSKSSVEDSKRFFGLEDVVYLPNPVIDEISDVQYENPFTKQDAINVLACGRLTKQKNYPLMLRSFAEALKKTPELQLTILGDGEEEGNLKSLCDKLGITGKVVFMGYTKNPQQYMQHASCLWLTSLFEGFGMVIVEALSVGCPVISVNCPHGPAEILEDGKYGKIVDSYDVNDNAAALVEFVKQEKKPAEFYQERAKDFRIIDCCNNYLRLVGYGS